MLGGADHPGVHRRQRLPGPEGRPHLRHRHPGRGDLDGDPALLPRPLDPREQHRPDDRVGGRHPRGDHLRAARPDHDRLVAGLPVLDDGRGLRRSAARSASCTRCRCAARWSPARTCPTRRASRPPRCSRSARPPKARRGRGGGRRGQPARPARDLVGSLAAAGFSLLAALKVIGNEVSAAFRVGSGGTLFGASLSLALIGVGHLVGVTVGVAMLVGLLIAYGVLLPTLTWGDLPGGADVSDVVSSTFGTRGAVRRGGRDRAWPRSGRCSRSSARSCGGIRRRRGVEPRRGAAAARSTSTERDLPIGIVGGTIAVLADPDRRCCSGASCPAHRSPAHTASTIVVSLVYIVVLGAVIAAVAGYMAGLIGSSNSPISGRRHPGRARASRCCWSALHGPAATRRDHGAGRLRAVHHRGGVLGRHDLQRQPAGPQDRPAGRRDPVEAAGRAGHRRGLRRGW